MDDSLIVDDEALVIAEADSSGFIDDSLVSDQVKPWLDRNDDDNDLTRQDGTPMMFNFASSPIANKRKRNGDMPASDDEVAAENEQPPAKIRDTHTGESLELVFKSKNQKFELATRTWIEAVHEQLDTSTLEQLEKQAAVLKHEKEIAVADATRDLCDKLAAVEAKLKETTMKLADSEKIRERCLHDNHTTITAHEKCRADAAEQLIQVGIRVNQELCAIKDRVEKEINAVVSQLQLDQNPSPLVS